MLHQLRKARDERRQECLCNVSAQLGWLIFLGNAFPVRITTRRSSLRGAVRRVGGKQPPFCRSPTSSDLRTHRVRVKGWRGLHVPHFPRLLPELLQVRPCGGPPAPSGWGRDSAGRTHHHSQRPQGRTQVLVHPCARLLPSCPLPWGLAASALDAKAQETCTGVWCRSSGNKHPPFTAVCLKTLAKPRCAIRVFPRTDLFSHDLERGVITSGEIC